MKPFNAFLLAIIVALTAAFPAAAQSPETIWISVPAENYKTGETILVAVNAVSSSPIQGFTFQIRYDPACLQPTQATSPIPGMNGLQLPQLPGLVDASFASSTPQTANGVLAEVRFVVLGGCQTSLTLESAALAIRNEAGFAAPLPGVSLGEKVLALNLSKERGVIATPPISGTPLILGEAPKSSTLPLWVVILISLIFGGG
ncbi:MAG: cohesin domain-containing protein, partial [Chloroflexi bacterium]|nr:cohesin domain-containing protein [Chloroflexota bacterium]